MNSWVIFSLVATLSLTAMASDDSRDYAGSRHPGQSSWASQKPWSSASDLTRRVPELVSPKGDDDVSRLLERVTSQGDPTQLFREVMKTIVPVVKTMMKLGNGVLKPFMGQLDNSQYNGGLNGRDSRQPDSSDSSNHRRYDDWEL